MIRFQALWKTKSFVKVCLKFKLPLWTKGLLIHLSPLWQLPLWHFPRWHNFPVYGTNIVKGMFGETLTSNASISNGSTEEFYGKFTAKIDFPIGHFTLLSVILTFEVQSLSIYFLISTWTTCWENLNKTLWSEPYKMLCFLTKCGERFLTKC